MLGGIGLHDCERLLRAMRILHLDDDRLQLDLARMWLEQEGHGVVDCLRGSEAIKAVERETFDLAVLDWNVPDVSGEEVLRWIRRRDHRIPVIFATANDEESEIAHILGLGADDYLVKPLRRLEFLARVNAVARRSGAGARPDEPIVEPPYVIDMQRHVVSLHNRPVKMTPRMVELAI